MLEIIVGNKPLKDTDYYTLATGSYIVNGGDNYPQFRDLEIVALGRPFSEVLLSYFKETDLVSVPKRGRLFPK